MAAVGPNPPASTVYGPDTLWWEPEPCAGQAEQGHSVLSAAQVEKFQREGFIALSDLWPQPLVEAAAAEAHAYFPLPQSRPPIVNAELDMIDPRGACDASGRCAATRPSASAAPPAFLDDDPPLLPAQALAALPQHLRSRRQRLHALLPPGGPG